MFLQDFEEASRNAAEEEFPGSEGSCCLFHLAQSVFRNLSGPVKNMYRQQHLIGTKVVYDINMGRFLFDSVASKCMIVCEYVVCTRVCVCLRAHVCCARTRMHMVWGKRSNGKSTNGKGTNR